MWRSLRTGTAATFQTGRIEQVFALQWQRPRFGYSRFRRLRRTSGFTARFRFRFRALTVVSRPAAARTPTRFALCVAGTAGAGASVPLSMARLGPTTTGTALSLPRRRCTASTAPLSLQGDPLLLYQRSFTYHVNFRLAALQTLAARSLSRRRFGSRSVRGH